MRAKSIAVLAGFTVSIGLLAGPSAWSQGSPAGPIGKTGKSVSGGSDPAPGPRIANVAGRWRWNAQCPGGRYQGQMQLTQSGDTFSGTIQDGDGRGGQHRVSEGKVTGEGVSFRRSVASGSQGWSGTMTGSSMSGSIAGVLGTKCSWSASR